MRTCRTLALIALVSTLFGCAGVQKPTSEDLVGHSVSVKAPLFKQNVGDLQLLRDGRWAIFADESNARPDLVEGQIMALGDLEMSFRHVFVVQESGSWGAYLSRLDSDALRPKLEGNLFPLGSEFDRAKMQRWRLCAGSNSELHKDSCISSYPVGTLFRVFDLNQLTGFQVPSALVRVGDPDSKLGVYPTRWIALPAGHSAPFTRSRIAVDGCQISHSSLDPVSAEIQALDSPFVVEEKAFELGVDAILKCRDGSLTAWVPGIFRERVPSSREIMRTSTLLSSKPISLKLGKNVNRVAALLAAVGAGDFAAANFHAGRLAKEDLDSNSGLLALSAELAPALNLTDLALHLSNLAVRRAWNPENDVYWTITKARIEAQLGQIGEASERWMSIPKLVQSDREESMNGWMLWNDFLQEVGKNPEGRAYDRLLDVAQGPLGHWREAIVAYLAATQDPKYAQELTTPSALKEAIGGFLPASLPRGDSADPAIDVCGLLAETASAKSVSRVGYSVFRPGFSRAKPSGLLEIAALSRFAPELAGELPRLIGLELDSGCKNATLSDQSAILKREYDDNSLWLITNALPTLCKNPAAIFDIEVPDAHVPALSMLLDDFFKDGRLGPEYLNRAAEVGRTPAALCHRWLLADAAQKFVAQDIQAANAALVKADQCSDPTLQSTSLSLRLLMDYEQTIRLRVVDDPQVMSRLQSTLGQRVGSPCIGSGPIRYDLKDLLPEDVLVYLTGVNLQLRSSDSDLLTATTLLSDASAELDSVRASFSATKVEGVEARLKDLESRFIQLGHQAGLARVRWLQSLVEKDALRKNVSEFERTLLQSYVVQGDAAFDALKDEPKTLCQETTRAPLPIRLE